MADLPKISQARLTGKPALPKDPIRNQGGFAAPVAHHPDANLLAAFVEKALTETERARVLHHLADCAECREVAAFSLPETVAETTPGRALGSWPVLRWGALAAIMSALAIVITVHPNIWQHNSKAVPLSISAGNTGGPPVMISAAPAAPPSSPAASRTGESARNSIAETNSKKSLRSLDSSDKVAAGGLASQHEAQQQVTTLASTRPPAQIQSASSSNAEQIFGGAAVAQSAPVPAAPSPAVAVQQAQIPTATLQNSPSAFQAAQQNAPASDSMAAKAAPRAAAQQSLNPPAQTSSPSEQRERQDSGAARGQASAKAQAGAIQVGALMGSAPAGFPSPTPRWFVTSEGKIVRTSSGRNSLEPIPIADGVKFRAVVALGNDVWAGGVGGALFHSTDGGATWTRVAVRLEDGRISATITGIQLGESRNVTLTVDSGARYVSEDAGQHWR